MSRPVMFVPSNFTVHPNAKIEFIDCRFYSKDMFISLTANRYKSEFGSEEKIVGWDIVSDDSVAGFKDKLDTLTRKQGENLL